MNKERNKGIKVLLIEANPEGITGLLQILSNPKNPAFDVEHTGRLHTGLERLSQGGIDVVLLDLFLPDSQGLDTLTRVKTQAQEVPIVALIPPEDEGLGMEAIRKGAQDYLIKGQGDGKMISRIICVAIDRKRVEENLRIRTDQLATVTGAMTAFLESGNWREASARLLRAALIQTLSQYGFVGVVVEGPVLRILAHEGITWDPAINREFYESAVRTYREVGYLVYKLRESLWQGDYQWPGGPLQQSQRRSPFRGASPRAPTFAPFLRGPHPPGK